MAHHVYSNQWCYSLMINYHTPDNHQILVVRSAFIKTTWISIPQKASVFAEWPTAKMSQWAFSLMDTWSDWEQIFQIFATKRRVEKVYFVKKRVPVMNGQQWNAFGDVQLHNVQFPPGVTYRPRSDHSHWWWSKTKTMTNANTRPSRCTQWPTDQGLIIHDRDYGGVWSMYGSKL